MEHEGMSIMEKGVLDVLIQPSPVLDGWKTYKLRGSDGLEYEYYYIPFLDNEMLAELWPFSDAPQADTMLYDLHSGAWFKACDLKVIRYNKRNIIVSPRFLESGGMVIDLMEHDRDGRFFEAGDRGCLTVTRDSISKYITKLNEEEDNA